MSDHKVTRENNLNVKRALSRIRRQDSQRTWRAALSTRPHSAQAALEGLRRGPERRGPLPKSKLGLGLEGCLIRSSGAHLGEPWSWTLGTSERLPSPHCQQPQLSRLVTSQSLAQRSCAPGVSCIRDWVDLAGISAQSSQTEIKVSAELGSSSSSDWWQNSFPCGAEAPFPLLGVSRPALSLETRSFSRVVLVCLSP